MAVHAELVIRRAGIQVSTDLSDTTTDPFSDTDLITAGHATAGHVAGIELNGRIQSDAQSAGDVPIRNKANLRIVALATLLSLKK